MHPQGELDLLAEDTNELMDQVSAVLATLRDAGHQHADIRWEEPDGSPHESLIGAEPSRRHYLVIRAGEQAVTLRDEPDEARWMDHHHSREINSLITPQGISATYRTPQIINQDGETMGPLNVANLDSPHLNVVDANTIEIDGAKLTVTLVYSKKDARWIEFLTSQGYNRSYPFSTNGKPTNKLSWLHTDSRLPDTPVRRNTCRVIVTANEGHQLDALSPNALIAVESAALNMLHRQMVQQNAHQGYAWTPPHGAIAELYAKHGAELGLQMPEIPQTAIRHNSVGHVLTPIAAVTTTGPMQHLVHRALSDPRNQELSVVPVSNTDQSLPTISLVETVIVKNDGTTVTIPAEPSGTVSRTTETIIGAASSIHMNMAVKHLDGSQERLRIHANLYADQEDGRRVLVYEKGKASEEDLAYYAVEPNPPKLAWEHHQDYRGHNDIYDDLTDIRSAITAKMATGDHDGAKAMAETISRQVTEYLTDGL